MNFQILGINHKTAPIELREKISFSDKNISQALKILKNFNSIKECLILSTCNRVEIYAMVTDISAGFRDIQNFIWKFHNIQEKEVKNHVYVYVNLEAVRHLFRVASSLDSMVIGEAQILGQVKDAYNKARENKSIGGNLENFFEQAVKLGKMVRLQTRIGHGAVSVGSAAVQLSKKIFKNLKGKKVLI
ncbi:MAG: glutamyl-tRNA reductase, partial [Elusimicrobiota bacterium]